MMGWVVLGFMGWVHIPPTMNSYNVKTFHFMNTHPPIKHIQSVILSLYNTLDGSWGRWWWGGLRVHGVGEWVVGWVVGEFMGWVVRGFMGWVAVWCGWWWGAWWGGWLEGSWGGCTYSPTHKRLQC